MWNKCLFFGGDKLLHCFILKYTKMFSYLIGAFISAYSHPQRKHFSEYMDLTYIFFFLSFFFAKYLVWENFLEQFSNFDLNSTNLCVKGTLKPDWDDCSHSIWRINMFFTFPFNAYFYHKSTVKQKSKDRVDRRLKIILPSSSPGYMRENSYFKTVSFE